MSLENAVLLACKVIINLTWRREKRLEREVLEGEGLDSDIR
jgi:hypothetical protein